MLKLFLADLKMIVRDRGSLFWSFAFPLMFTVIFGFFFGKGSIQAGTVGLIDKSNSQISQSLEKAMTDSGLFKVQKETDETSARDLIIKGKITAVIIIPENFGELQPNAPKTIKLIDDPANLQANAVLMGFLNNFLTTVNFQVQNAKPLFTVSEEKTTQKALSYFDFVLMGLIGMALMNSSIQGVSIRMSKYREDKILKRITTTPLPAWKFILAEVMSRLILNFIQVALILAVGIFGFKAHLYGNFLILYVFTLIGAVLFQSMGFVIAAVTKTVSAAEGMATAVAIPMMFLAGVFFPIDQLPRWLSSVVQFLPLAPLLRMIRTIGLEAGSPFTNPMDIVIVLVWIVVMLFIAGFRFRLTEE